jgi:TRAP-type C4-dicarboxylate transport system substrate-binding protein
MMQMPEIYTAMERGVVDGFIMATIGFVKGFSWHEVTKYMIDHGFYRGSVACIANPKKWSTLSKDLQNRIMKWKYEVFDPKAEQFYIKQGKFNKKLIYDSKVEVIQFSKQDAEAFLKLAYESAWGDVYKKAPDVAPKLKAMIVK